MYASACVAVLHCTAGPAGTVCCSRLLGPNVCRGMAQMEMKMMRDAYPHSRDPVYWEQMAKLKGLAPARITMCATSRSSHAH